jgi:hypothetical protein
LDGSIQYRRGVAGVYYRGICRWVQEVVLSSPVYKLSKFKLRVTRLTLYAILGMISVSFDNSIDCLKSSFVFPTQTYGKDLCSAVVTLCTENWK